MSDKLLGTLLKCRGDLIGQGKICISNMLSGEADAAGPDITREWHRPSVLQWPAICLTSPTALPPYFSSLSPFLHKQASGAHTPPLYIISIYTVCPPHQQIPFLQRLLSTRHQGLNGSIPGPLHLLPLVICAPANFCTYYAKLYIH